MGLEKALGFRDKLQHKEKPCHMEKSGLDEKPGVTTGLEKPGLCPSFVLGGCVTRGTQEAPGNVCTKGNSQEKQPQPQLYVGVFDPLTPDTSPPS